MSVLLFVFGRCFVKITLLSGISMGRKKSGGQEVGMTSDALLETLWVKFG